MCQLFNCLSEVAVCLNHHVVELLGVATVRLPLPSAVGEAGDANLLAAVRTRDQQHIGVRGVLVVNAGLITEQGATLGAHGICLSGGGDESGSGDGCGDGELLEHGFVCLVCEKYNRFWGTGQPLVDS